MHKDRVATPMAPFTDDEEAALFGRLDVLSVPDLENYIDSARNSLGNRALEPTWRPRIELALGRAEIVLQREQLALAAQEVAQAAPPAPARKTKAKAEAKAE
jgi:hypothetical protein